MGMRDAWDYRQMWLLSIGLFTSVAWGPVLVEAGLHPLKLGDSPGLAPSLHDFERWVVVPQIRLLLFLAPPLIEKWPGPLYGTVSMDHRLLLVVVYGLLGWISARLVFYMQDWWVGRVLWLIVAWGICFCLLEVPAVLLTQFRILSNW